MREEVLAENEAEALKQLAEDNLIVVSIGRSPLQSFVTDMKHTFGFLFGTTFVKGLY